jgi:hypothetical protein
MFAMFSNCVLLRCLCLELTVEVQQKPAPPLRDAGASMNVSGHSAARTHIYQVTGTLKSV